MSELPASALCRQLYILARGRVTFEPDAAYYKVSPADICCAWWILPGLLSRDNAICDMRDMMIFL